MTNIFETIRQVINASSAYLETAGPVLGCLLIILESILPVLPLFVFITLNCVAFGYFFGYILSWICTCLGSALSFLLFRNKVQTWFNKKIRVMKEANRIMKVIEKCKVHQLAMICAVPFTPAFLVNIAGGLSKMSPKRFLVGICIGKLFMVYFWAFIGTNLIQSLTNPIILIRVIVMVAIAYLLSKLVTKKFDL